jgi:hypothetical protein
MTSEASVIIDHAGQTPSELRARATFYRLLAGAFIEEPEASYLAPW